MFYHFSLFTHKNILPPGVDMNRLLRPELFSTDPSSPTAAQEWKHWKKTFENFLGVLSQDNVDKLGLLVNYVSPRIYETISESATYDNAISALQCQYVKPTNEIFARYQLATRRQQPGETLDEYFQALKSLGKECNFKAVTATQHCEESIRDAFISGLQSALIRQCLLENKTLDLATMYDQSIALDSAQKNSNLYNVHPGGSVIGAAAGNKEAKDEIVCDPSVVASAVGVKCCLCGLSKHPRSRCPAREAMCYKCKKKGHFAKVSWYCYKCFNDP